MCGTCVLPRASGSRRAPLKGKRCSAGSAGHHRCAVCACAAAHTHATAQWFVWRSHKQRGERAGPKKTRNGDFRKHPHPMLCVETGCAGRVCAHTCTADTHTPCCYAGSARGEPPPCTRAAQVPNRGAKSSTHTRSEHTQRGQPTRSTHAPGTLRLQYQTMGRCERIVSVIFIHGSRLT